MLRTREEWKEHCKNKETWADQVFDILDDWEESEELLTDLIIKEGVTTRKYLDEVIEKVMEKIKENIGELC